MSHFCFSIICDTSLRVTMAGSGTPRAGVVSVIRVRRQPPECHTPCQGEVLGTDPSMSDIKLVIDVRTQVHTCMHTRDPDGIQTVHTVHTATRKDTDYCKLLSTRISASSVFLYLLSDAASHSTRSTAAVRSAVQLRGSRSLRCRRWLHCSQ